MDIRNWAKSLRAHNGKRAELLELFRLLIGDLQLWDSESTVVYHRVQNARPEHHKGFKWKSEVLGGLRNLEKQPSKKLYMWEHQMEKHGMEIPDLIKIVIPYLYSALSINCSVK